MSALSRVNWDTVEPGIFPEALRWCIWTFARGLPTETSKASEICGVQVLSDFLAIGLLRPAKKSPTALVCPVWLYPVEGFLVASDRCDDPDGDSFTPAADIVFPAIYAGTLRYLKLLPEVHGGDPRPIADQTTA